MAKMEENSIDFIVTDPPYGISFMSRGWDKEIPPIEYWQEMLRVCKPGSYMACAGLPRMIHRLGCAVEDSGWVIRDMVMHIFGSGFPKSHNFGRELGEAWNGYGTALKPAWEGWIIAMKPLDGTFKQNAEKWGVGGINIDDNRIASTEDLTRECLGHASASHEGYKRPYHELAEKKVYGSITGRWPANVIFDEEAGKALDEMSGVLKSGDPGTRRKKFNGYNGGLGFLEKESGFGDSGGASRFFYCAKASSKERNAGLDKPSTHPTVKPIALMKYIIKLLAPPDNPTLLDPFCGSGSTLIAAKELGIKAIGIEKEAEYCEIARKRTGNANGI